MSPVVVIRLEGYQSLFAEVQTLVAMLEERHTASAGAFHILLVDGSLLDSLAGNENRH